MRPTTLAAAAASTCCLAACAAPAVPAASVRVGAELRVMVKLPIASSDTAAVADRVARAAGTSARYIAASSPQWHALALQCADMPACEAAYARLKTESAAFDAVQRDERRRIVSP